MVLSRRRLAALLFLISGWCAAPAGADLAEVQKRGKLRVLVMLDVRRPEFFATAPDGYTGFDAKVLNGFVRLSHLELEVIPMPAWDALIPALLEGKGDIIAGRFTATESRRKTIAFSAETFPTRNVVLTRRPHLPILTTEALRKERVGTIKGTSMAEAIAAAGVPASNVDDAIPAGGFPEALKSGRISAAVWGVESAIAARREDPELGLGMFLGPPGSLAYGLRKEDTALRSALDGYIENLRRTPTWNRLVVEFFGESSLEILKKAREQ